MKANCRFLTFRYGIEAVTCQGQNLILKCDKVKNKQILQKKLHDKFGNMSGHVLGSHTNITNTRKTLYTQLIIKINTFQFMYIS